MKNYTDKQIAEFAKMGYHIDATGRLTKEVKLQKIIRTNADTVTMKSLELKTFETSSRKSSESRVQIQRTMGNTFTRVQDWFMDEERLAKGLVTMRKPGVDYSLLPDGTKVCRCCQDRFSKELFNVTNANKDGLSNNCKKCDTKRTKSYNADKKANQEYKIKNQGK